MICHVCCQEGEHATTSDCFVALKQALHIERMARAVAEQKVDALVWLLWPGQKARTELYLH